MGVDDGRIDMWVGVELKSAQALVPRERSRFDPAFGTAACPVVAFGHEQLGQEAAVGHLVAGGGLGEVTELTADGRQAQQPAGGVDRCVGGLFGESSVASHGRFPSAVRGGRRSSWNGDIRYSSCLNTYAAATARPGRPAVRLLRIGGLPWMKELLWPKFPSPESLGERDLADDSGGPHEDRADVVVEAVDPVRVVVPVLQLEGAFTISSGPALSAGVLVIGGEDGANIDEGSSAWSGCGQPR